VITNVNQFAGGSPVAQDRLDVRAPFSRQALRLDLNDWKTSSGSKNDAAGTHYRELGFLRRRLDDSSENIKRTLGGEEGGREMGLEIA
jgi:hypothetical protein